ncbi:MAG: RnfABCDGE type electron transport complex subunit G [Candidatus Omnitrophica bacterium]|nr:RnfABCDGE type electron transport complex subunit G [Candidatus Omnitrophota bacterium]
MNQLIKFGIVLALICFAATLVLAFTYEITKPKIEKGLEQEEKNALSEIMPEADSFDAKSTDGIDYFEALSSGKTIGYCIKVTGTGYNGYIRMIAGIDEKGTIKGIRVLEQYETPGLGARINEKKPGEKEPAFLKQFNGKNARALEIKKDVDAITGATISSKAVTDAVRDTTSQFLDKIKTGKTR